MTEILFVLLLAIILFVYLGYPFTLWILGAFLRKSSTPSNITPFVSVIIPAHNEEKCIGKKIENCLALDYPKEQLEIIVGSDGSDDATDSIVQEYASQGVVLSTEGRRTGKCSVLKRCVGLAKGEIILFTDADAVLEKDSLKMVVRNFSDPHIGCVEGVRRDRNEQGIMLDNLYWKYETMIKKLNSRLQAILGATGAIFAVRRELYDPINAQRGDDFEIPVRVRVKGFGAVLEPKALAYHPWLSNRDEFRRIVRIVAWMLPSALILLSESIMNKRWLLAFQLLVHKVMRWMVPFFLIVLFVVNMQITGTVFRSLLWGQILFYLLAILGLIFDHLGNYKSFLNDGKSPQVIADRRFSRKKDLRLPTLLKVPYFFCLINAASFVGILKSILGWGSMDWAKTAREQ
jgi:glycosyltransferase involved in cell wall biosynthesis